MKILHAKTSNEKIRVGSACHAMNLFALATLKSITVYRIANMTVVWSLKLENRRDECPAVTCIAWSPTGRLVAFGFEKGWSMIVHVESGDVVRIFRPADAAGPSNSQPPMLIAQSEGGPQLRDSVQRSYSLRSTSDIVSCEFAKCPESLCSGKTSRAALGKCLQLPNANTVAPLLFELESSAESVNVSALLIMSSTLEVSVSVGGLVEIGLLHLTGDDYFVNPFAPVSHALERRPCKPCQSLLQLSSNQLLLVLPTAPTTQRLFSAPCLSLRHLLCNATVTASFVEEYVLLGDHAMRWGAAAWSRFVEQVLAECNLPQAASVMRSALLPPVCTPDMRAVEAVFSSLSLAKMVRLGEALRECLTNLMDRVHGEATVAFEAALTLAATLFDDDDETYKHICERVKASKDLICYVRREAEHIAELLRWLAQQVLRYTTNNTTGLSAAGTGALTSSPGAFILEPLPCQHQTHVLRTLHRLMNSAPTVKSPSGMSLGHMMALSEAWHGSSHSRPYGHALRSALEEACFTPAASGAFDRRLVLRDVGVSANAALGSGLQTATHTASFVMLSQNSDASDSDVLIQSLRVTADGAVPVVSAYTLGENGCLLDSGPAPVDVSVLGGDAQNVVAHASVDSDVFVVMSRANGVALGRFDANGECLRIQDEESDLEGATKTDVLIIDGLTCGKDDCIAVSLSPGRGYGAVYNRDRFIVIELV